MKIAAEDGYVELIPETSFEVEQLARLDAAGGTLKTEVIAGPYDPYPPAFTKTCRLRLVIPQREWGT